jgi:hypothetical protein
MDGNTARKYPNFCSLGLVIGARQNGELGPITATISTASRRSGGHERGLPNENKTRNQYENWGWLAQATGSD